MKQLITFSGLKEKGHPYTRRHTERLVEAGKFPAPIKIGDGPRGRIAWDEAEVEAFYSGLAAQRGKQKQAA